MQKKSPSAGKKLRSRAYPAASLADSIDVLRKLNMEIGLGERDRDTIAKALGYAGGDSGIGGRKVASLVHFGLMDLRSGLYGTTDLARQILEAKAAVSSILLKEAFLSPTLFREIVNRYESAERVPRQLALTLSLDHGIQEHAREEVAQIFMESAVYAGVLEVDGYFRRSYFEDMQRPRTLSLEPATGLQPPMAGATMESRVSTRELRFPVTDLKEIILHLPSTLNEEDISLLRLQVDFLESQVRQSHLGRPLRFESHRGDRKRE